MKPTLPGALRKPWFAPFLSVAVSLTAGLACSLSASLASAQAKAPPLPTPLSIGLQRMLARAVPSSGSPVGRAGSLSLASRSDAISPAVKVIAGFFSVGGYFLTNRSGRSALGNVKFAGATTVFARPAYPKALGGLALTGGGQIFSANDHFFPFSGGSSYTLIGPAFSIATRKATGRPRAYLIGGLYYGQLRSERLHFDRSSFTPSFTLGADYVVGRYVTVYAGYRVSQEIRGYNTDGFSVGFKIF